MLGINFLFANSVVFSVEEFKFCWPFSCYILKYKTQFYSYKPAVFIPLQILWFREHCRWRECWQIFYFLLQSLLPLLGWQEWQRRSQCSLGESPPKLPHWLTSTSDLVQRSRLLSCRNSRKYHDEHTTKCSFL